VRLPQTNATLTAVDAVGASEDYDRPASAGSAKWSGAEPVYLSERRDRVGAVRGIERHRIPTVTQNTIRLTLEDQ
jgi:arginine/lysine/ornithine decarboxylase